MDAPGPVTSTDSASRREIWSWAFFDFAISAYSTALVGVVFSVYFVRNVVGPEGLSVLGMRLQPESVWSYCVSFSMLVVALTAPVLGAVADYTASKKKFLLVFCYGGALATAFLFLVRPGDVWLAIVFYLLSNIALESSMTFYNGFLPEIAPREQMGWISGFGWALGYVGGVLCLVLNLGMIQRPAWFGLSEADYLPVRFSLLTVAVWWAVFALPTFIWVRERAVSRPVPAGMSYVRVGFGRLLETLRKFGRYRELFKFLIAFLLYNDGVQTVIALTAVFGAQALGMSEVELMLCFIAIHVVAFFGSIVFGHISDRYSTKTSIHLNLIIWTAVTFYVLLVDQSWEFWLLGLCGGFGLGGIQASSRALLAHFTPPENSAEFFGFFSTAGRFAAVLGPLLLGLVTDLTGNLRLGVASIVVFFALGWVFFFSVDEQKGRAESALAVSD